MKSFNISEWALEHRSFVWFLMVIAAAAGIMAYQGLGREEDPPFTVKTMVVQQNWPGATVREMVDEVAERLEKEIKQIDAVDYVESYTTPSQTTLFVHLRNTTDPKIVPWEFYQVRKHVQDIQYTMPAGVSPPGFNDEFGDVFGTIYAFTADGLSHRQLRDYVDQARHQVMTVPNTGKLTEIGEQDEVIYLDFSIRKIAALGLNVPAVIATLRNQNAVQPSGVMQAGPETISLRVSGQFASEAALRGINLRINDKFFPLTDIATITRGYADPPEPLFRFDGKPAIGLGIAMVKGANVVRFGHALQQKMQQIEASLPIGVGIHLVADQPQIVREAVGGFSEALFEAVAIVLIVSFISLGLRAGIVVSLSIPLVLACVFVVMSLLGVTLQRVSLGALIIALGLLVDDAMITVEMMVRRLENGDPLNKAATFAYTATAFPMLTGTLVTVAGFMPVGLNASEAGEYTFTLFVVIAVALLISWIVAVLFAPLIGVTVLPKALARQDESKPALAGRMFLRGLTAAMRFHWATIGICAALLLAALAAATRVEQQFFPASDRSDFLVDMTLPQNSTILETKAQVDRFEAALAGDPDIERWSSYVGQGAIRFYLPLDQQLNFNFFGQIVIVARSLEARDRVMARLTRLANDQFVGIDVFIHSLEIGPPVGRPVQYRLGGPSLAEVQAKALELARIMHGNPHLQQITLNWNEPARVVRVDIDQDKARQYGLSSADVAAVLNGMVGGTTITQVRDSIYLVDVVGRAATTERHRIETLENLQISTGNGKVVPLLSFATITYTQEPPIVWRRDRMPTITVRGTIGDTTQAATVVQQLAPEMSAFAKSLPPDMKLATGGAVEEAARGETPIVAVVPVMLLVMAFVLMVQLQSVQKLILVTSVAPLGAIGVVAALLVSGKPMGFVAILGIVALIGIIVRNSVILVAQIDEDLAEGKDRWTAVVDATQHRMRPILLTASAASLGMIPIATQVFWSPMAFAMIGGIFAATLLTLFFLPALYVAWFRIKETESRDSVGQVPNVAKHA